MVLRVETKSHKAKLDMIPAVLNGPCYIVGQEDNVSCYTTVYNDPYANVFYVKNALVSLTPAHIKNALYAYYRVKAPTYKSQEVTSIPEGLQILTRYGLHHLMS